MLEKKRNFGLDIARASSILLVLIAHRFSLPIELGILGVQIFFVLSGFLIGQILINDFRNDGKLSTILKFWKRRWYRTLPLYYLVLIFKILFYGNPYGWKIIVYFLFLQANIVGINFLGVSWSLVIEEWFYIFLPITTFLFFRKGIDFKKFTLYIFSFIFIFLLTRFLWNFFHKGVIIYQFDCLLLGVLIASIKIFYPKIYIKLNSSLLFLIGVFLMSILVINLGEMKNIYIYDTYRKVIWYFLISISIALIIPFIEQSSFLNTKIKTIRPLFYFYTWTSILTYSIYLIHMFVFEINFNNYPLGINICFQILILYAICFLVYALFEHPMLNLREKLSLKQYVNTIKSFTFKI